MGPDRDAMRSDAQAGGDPACWLDQVRDCCGTLQGEPHRRGCAHAHDAGDEPVGHAEEDAPS